MTTKERLGWRDEALSRWHRDMGYELPAADVDFLLVEYHRRIPRGMIDYKHENARKISLKSANVAALAWMANRCALPYFIVRYAADLSWFSVMPVNRYARKFVSHKTIMSKTSFTKLLIDLRGVAAKNLESLRAA